MAYDLWPMTAVWPSVSPALSGDHGAEGVCCAVSWVGGFLHSVIQLSTVYGLPFCGPNVIDHFICDMFPLLKLVCTDTYVTDLLVASNGGLICTAVSALTRLLWSHPALSEEPESGRDAESPADLWFPHRCVVCFFVPSIFVSARPAKTFPIDKSLSVFYTVISPMLNPLIYSLRNSELSNSMKKVWRRNIVAHFK